MSKALRLAGSAATGPYTKGIRAFERGENDKARERLESARRLDPELAPVHEALALVYHRLGEYEAGLEAVDAALEQAPRDPDLLRIRYEALVSLFKRSLELDPDNLKTRLGLAEVYLRQERYAECLAEIDRIESRHPGNAHARRIAERARARMAD